MDASRRHAKRPTSKRANNPTSVLIKQETKPSSSTKPLTPHQHNTNTEKRWPPRSVWLPPGRPATPLPVRVPRPPPWAWPCAACPLRVESTTLSPTPWTDSTPRRYAEREEVRGGGNGGVCLGVYAFVFVVCVVIPFVMDHSRGHWSSCPLVVYTIGSAVVTRSGALERHSCTPRLRSA